MRLGVAEALLGRIEEVEAVKDQKSLVGLTGKTIPRWLRARMEDCGVKDGVE